MSGEDFDLHTNQSNNAILEIQSPRDHVAGPYVVVHKDIDERWVIVALDWDRRPSLGMRWFWRTKGNPVSTGHPTWFIVPSGLTHGLLSSLPLSPRLRHDLDEFLLGKMPGQQLKATHHDTSTD